ncbi:Uma2 family endonuclease [Streptomyces sp. MAR4 CNX-425]|uniref:Uma2 family endonuclease n=1 Tax=Streptomyces sp. MAR4 CNX-425 TaxID=3406343 RepID=UPI003B501366
MADESDELTLDKMFEWLERMPVPGGYRVEIVEGVICMSPQRDTLWDTIYDILDQLRARYSRRRLKSDVRIDYPGHLNGFASDVVALGENAAKNDEGRWRSQDVEFVGEVISKGTAANDYGPKRAVYAAAEVPVYLIVDPYTAKCRVHLKPKDGKYRVQSTLAFGVDIDLTDTPVGLKLATGEFPRD